jgi:hypothetical protein
MARQQRSTPLTQESTRPITQVAPYARVSTLNNQDPEMQLAELREYSGRKNVTEMVNATNALAAASMSTSTKANPSVGTAPVRECARDVRARVVQRAISRHVWKIGQPA